MRWTFKKSLAETQSCPGYIKRVYTPNIHNMRKSLNRFFNKIWKLICLLNAGLEYRSSYIDIETDICSFKACDA